MQEVPFDKQVVYCDIDGTLTNETEGYGNDIYAQRTPNRFLIDYINGMYDEGHDIILWTARHEEDTPITIKWLEYYGVKYHKLIMGKPHYDILIDDLTVHPLVLENVMRERK